MKERKQRPGAVLYYSDWHTIARRLDMAKRGELVTALMTFAETGEWTEISDQMTAFAFELMAEKVIRDEEAYHNRCLKNAHNTYQRECYKKGEEPLPFDEWLSIDNERHQSTTSDIEIIQTEKELETETDTELESGDGNRSVNGARVGGCKGGASLRELRDEWNAALDAGNKDKACILAQQLAGLGYDADQRTRTLTLRS